MNFPEAVKSAFSKYVTFSGRATRSEYWYFILFVWIVNTLIMLATGTFYGAWQSAPHGFGMDVDSASSSPLSEYFMLAVLLPGLAVSARRLHDTDKSGWWQLLWWIPVVGWIILIVWYCTKGSFGPNRFGV